MLPQDFFDKLDVETDDPRIRAQRRQYASDVCNNPVFREVTKLLMLDVVDSASKAAKKGEERKCMVAMLSLGALQDVTEAFEALAKPIENTNIPERADVTGA